MAVIKQLKKLFTGEQVFPVTKTNAVYDDTVGRLDSFLQNVMMSSDELEGETEDAPRDADRLGGELPEYYAKQSDLAYKDISGLFTTNKDAVSWFLAYVENGVVCINVLLKAGFTGSVNVANISDMNYCPRHSISGNYLCSSDSTDKDKYVASYISADGKIYIWCDNALTDEESVSFVYPARRI